MAGYFLYTLDGAVFSQLTTSPTDQQAQVFARYVLNRVRKSNTWPKDLDALAVAIKTRLAMPNWYSDLSTSDAQVWDDVVFSLCDEPGEEIGIGFQCSDYESIYWDCAEEAAAQGVEMMQEPTFGSSGYRFFGDLAHDYGYHRTYSIFDSDTVRKLLKQLNAIEPHFAALPDEGGGSLHEQFFQGLLPPVKYAAESDRVLFVQTDT